MFGVYGLIRYSWIMLLFIPVGLISLVFSFKLKKDKQNYKKNFIIACICVPILIIFGSYRFIFTNITYNTNYISTVETKMGIELPNNIKIATDKSNTKTLSYAKIIDETEKNKFEDNIKYNDLWKLNLSSRIKDALLINIQYEVDNYDYFIGYDVTNNQFNTNIDSNESSFILVAYSCKLQKLIIVENY